MDTKKTNTNSALNKVTACKTLITDKVIDFICKYNYKQLNILAILIVHSVINNVKISNVASLKSLIAVISGLRTSTVAHTNKKALKTIITDVLVSGKFKGRGLEFYTADCCSNLNNNYTRKAVAVISNDGKLDGGKDVPQRDVKWVTSDTYKKLCMMDANYWQDIVKLYCAFNKLNTKETIAKIKANLSKDNKANTIQEYTKKAFANAKTA